jgi:hypothetical protein
MIIITIIAAESKLISAFFCLAPIRVHACIRIHHELEFTTTAADSPGCVGHSAASLLPVFTYFVSTARDSIFNRGFRGAGVTTSTACSICRVPKSFKVMSVGATSIFAVAPVPIAIIVWSITVIPSTDIITSSINGGRLSEAEERTVSVLTCQEAKMADAIKVTYLDGKGKQKDGELHSSWVDSVLSSRKK